MLKLAPIKRKDLINYLRQLGFDGPYSGGNHQFMKKDALKIRLPNPHQSEIGRDLLVRILKQGNIEKTTWGNL